MKMLGMIREIDKDKRYLSIREMISDTPSTYKREIINYLKCGKVTAAAPGSATDVLTGEKIPCALKMQTDGEFEWRSDVAYYVDKYNLQLDSEFVEKVISKQRRK
jgi:hypothetical protein